MALVAAFYLFPFIRIMPSNGDEGQVPYRDFFETFTPGSFYWVAAVLHLFGATMATAQGLLLATGVVLALLVDRCSRHLTPGSYDLLPTTLFLVFGLPFWPLISHHWDSTVLAMLTCRALLRWCRRPTSRGLLATGWWAGLTALFLQTKGVAIFLGSWTTVLLATRRQGMDWREGARRTGALAAGPLLLGLATLFFFQTQGALAPLLDAVVRFPLTRYANVSGLPYGHFFWESVVPGAIAPGPLAPLLRLTLIVPGLIVLYGPFALLLCLFARLMPWGREGPIDLQVVGLYLSAFALWASELHRPCFAHLLFGSPLLYVAGLHALRLVEPHRPRLFRGMAFCLLACLAIFGLGTMMATWEKGTLLATRRGPMVAFGPDPGLAFLLQETRPGEEVFIYPYNTGYYFLADVRNPTRFSHLLYGYHRPEQFAEAIQALETRQVGLVLLNTLNTPEQMHPGYLSLGLPSREERVMENHLERRYREVATVGCFQVLRRREDIAAPPADVPVASVSAAAAAE
ncbi:MAG: hypothetical protein GX442_16250 [Candidatus Riflebacteria bacterium]|nr:hypothetical protein [Candidatus Riflebacteria bacterium]